MEIIAAVMNKNVFLCIFSPKLKSYPDKTFSLLHDQRVDSRRGGQRLSSTPHHDHHRISFAVFGQEVDEACSADRTKTLTHTK